MYLHDKEKLFSILSKLQTNLFRIELSTVGILGGYPNRSLICEACQISEWLDYSEYKSFSFQPLPDLG